MKKRKSYIIISMLLAIVLLLTFLPVYGEVNPSREEIARKLEKIAHEKKIPSVILKTVAFAESGWRQWYSTGQVVGDDPLRSKPALGIMQIVSYDSQDEELIAKLKYDIDFNIAYGADLLNEKWAFTPTIGNGNRNILENWYFALWAYHGWTVINNPHDRSELGEVPYQEAIYRLAATEYFPGYVTPVEITRIDPLLITPGTLPGRDTVWATPEPFHYGDLEDLYTNDDLIGEAAEEAGLNDGLGYLTRIVADGELGVVEQIAVQNWPLGTQTVILARSDDFPDALAGVPLARKYDCPILLTSSSHLDAPVKTALDFLAPKRVILLGGEGALATQIEQELWQQLPLLESVDRIAGANRYETAALVALDFAYADKVALTTGLNYPDALSMAAAAASEGIPILLSAKDSLPEATITTLREYAPQEILIAGGEGVIGVPIIDLLLEEDGLSFSEIRRYAGADRYETSVEIARSFYSQEKTYYFANGLSYAESLAAGAAAASKGACFLLVDQQGIQADSELEKYLKEIPAAADLFVVGLEGEDGDLLVVQIAEFVFSK